MSYIGNLFELYAGNGVLMVLYLAAWVTIIILEKKKESKIAFAFSAWYLPVVLLNPLVGALLEKGNLLPERMVRLYWLIPVFPVIAYGCVLLVQKAESKCHMGAIMTMLLLIGMVLIGKPVVSGENFVKAENLYKLPDGVLQVVDCMNEDAEQVGISKEEYKAVMPLSLSTYARQYDGKLSLLYGRYPVEEDAVELYELMQHESLAVDRIIELAQAKGCRYLVLDSDRNWESMPSEDIAVYIGGYGNYCLYRLN